MTATTRWTRRVFRKPMLNVVQMSAMATCITNHKDTTNTILADRTPKGKVLTRLTNIGPKFSTTSTSRTRKNETNTHRCSSAMVHIFLVSTKISVAHFRLLQALCQVLIELGSLHEQGPTKQQVRVAANVGIEEFHLASW